MSGTLIHQKFEAQVVRSPRALAVADCRRELTYAELNASANHLARQLLSAGVQVGQFVAVWAERSVDTVVHLLAIAKTGAAYLPLDPSYPSERLAFMLRETDARVILAANPLEFPAGDLERLSASDISSANAASEEDVPARGNARDLAYVIFTSGSTGQPKGVLIEHAAVVNTLDDVNERFHVGPHDRVLCLSSFGFDLSVYDVFGVLGAGGALILPDDRSARDPAKWAQLMMQYRVTLWNTVPAMIELMVSHCEVANSRALDSLRLAMLSGDWIAVSLPERIRRLNPAAQVVSLGGATEASIWSIAYPIEKVDPKWRSIPYGQALRNQSFHVLDEQRQPCAPGVPGELYIGGEGLARGYLNRPELTNERFIADPSAADSRARLYRTGDLGRLHPDGNIEFLGRVDAQVKINGNRVELGEVETSLARHPAVREAAVVAPRDAAGRRRLVAFVVPAQETGTTRSNGAAEGRHRAEVCNSIELKWREHLSRILPAYMLPTRFVTCTALPLSSHGKVDRQALADEALSLRVTDRSRIAPRDEVETRITAIWQEVLKTDTVSIDDRFVECGGDSLQMVDLMLRINAAFRTELPVAVPLLEAPTPADLAAKVKSARQITSQPAPRRSAKQREFPASPGQQQLWTVEQTHPCGPAYNIASLYNLTGRINSSALARSLNSIVARHEALRTVFRLSEHGTLLQVVRRHQPFEIPQFDLRTLPPDDRAAAARIALNKSARQQFDLANDRMLRALILQLDEDEFQLLITTHHIASDAWSLSVMNQQLAVLYRQYAAGEKSEVLPTTQYIEYTLDLERRLRPDRQLELSEYWQRQLAGPLPLLELSSDFPRPATPTYTGSIYQFMMPPELVSAVRDLAADQGATLFMGLLAGFTALLARYSGQSDIVVGSPVAGRNVSDLARSIGYFVNVLALRIDLSGDPSFLELLHRARQVTSDALLHQDMPLAHLASQLKFDRRAGDQAPFRAMLVLNNEPIEPLKIPGVDVAMSLLDLDAAKADLVLSLTEFNGGIEAALEYRTDLFTAKRIEQWSKHFERLLWAAARQPQTPVGELPMLTMDEMQMMEVYSGTETDYPRDATIVELFEVQVHESPDAPALVFDSGAWTYADLNRQADEIAARLLAAGVKVGAAIGIYLDRSPELVASLLGILKAGGVYVPLDRDYPASRLQFMVLDANLRMAITCGKLAGSSIAWDIPVLDLDRLPSSSPMPTPAALARPILPTDPAYILYTSGSTGQPKGVAIPHRAVVRLVKQANYIEFTSTDVFLQCSPVSFDAATLEIWGPLLNGGCLALAPAGVQTIAQLGGIVKRHGVTTLWLTAGLFHRVVDDGLELFRGLKYLLAGGDVLSPEHVRKALGELPDVTLVNGYGPTENTTFTTCYLMQGADAFDSGSVPIGRPISNTQVYILDRRLQQVPCGMPGEIHCAGDGLAIGYVNRPDLNDQKFVEMRRTDGSTVRVYKTGDLARFLPDGTIQFLGRLDQQVKIRGFRVETGEIESALCRHPAVRQAAVVVTDAALHKQLIAYVAIGTRSPIPATELQALLRSTLPAYMIPAHFVCLDQLPLDANGKINRRALPPIPSEPRAASGAQNRPPDQLERRLASVWKIVFDLPEVDVEDDFFVLGGDSLMAVSLLSRIDREFGASLQFVDLVQNPTVANLANLLRKNAAPQRTLAAVEIQRGGLRPILFFAPCIEGNLMTIRALASRLDVEQPVYALQPIGVDGRGNPHRSVPEVVEHYLEQVRRVQPRGPYLLSGYSFGGTVAHEMARRLSEAGDTVKLLILIDAPARGRLRPVHWGNQMVKKVGRLVPAGTGRNGHGLSSDAPGPNESLIAAHCNALSIYHPQAYMGRTVIIRAAKPPHPLKQLLDGMPHEWPRRGLVDPATHVIWIPGDHETIFAKPQVDILAEQMQQQLNLALAGC
jgi:amino acid adenylation domain-containing protein